MKLPRPSTHSASFKQGPLAQSSNVEGARDGADTGDADTAVAGIVVDAGTGARVATVTGAEELVTSGFAVVADAGTVVTATLL